MKRCEQNAGPRLVRAFVPAVEWFAERFEYDPQSGAVTSRATGRAVGAKGPRGRLTVAYRHGQHRGAVLRSRLAWALFTGDWPQGQLQYRDGNPNNAAWENLSVPRLVGQRRGHVRVTPGEGCWLVPLYVDGRRTTRGFKDRADALAFADAVRRAARDGRSMPDALEYRGRAAYASAMVAPRDASRGTKAPKRGRQAAVRAAECPSRNGKGVTPRNGDSGAQGAA